MLAVSRRLNKDSVCLCKSKFERFHQVSIKQYAAYPSLWGRFLKKWHMHWPGSRGPQADQSDQELFQELVDSHDIVWFHTLYAANPFRLEHKTIPSVIDLDDLNHCKYEQHIQYKTTLRLKLSSKVQAIRWKTAELNAPKRFSCVVVCSNEDKKCLGSSQKIQVIPNGFTRPDNTPVWKPSDSSRIGFIGSLDYYPNHDGLVWFRDEVWPLLRKQKPEMRLRIVGSPPTYQNKIEAEGFEYLGFLDDPTEEMQSWSSMIVPVLYGGGTRIKIIDAFSKMCPVVSTPIGAHGNKAVHEESILLATSPDEFARACLDLSNSPEKGQSLARAGWKLFLEQYTWEQIGTSIRQIVNELI
jgi:glycosyltransferase involved in cell wall biosynthesis